MCPSISARLLLLLIVLVPTAAACGDDSSDLLGIAGTSTTVPPPSISISPPAPDTSEAPPETSPEPTTTTTEGPTVPASTTTSAPATTSTTSTTSTMPAPSPTQPAPPAPVVTAAPSSETSAEPPLQIDVILPVVSGVPEGAGTAINAVIGAEVLPRAAVFRSEVESFSGEDFGDLGSFMVIDFEATAATPEVLSLRFTETTYFAGAANPNSVIFTLSFDPQSGDLLMLDDVLVDGGRGDVAALVERHLVDELYGGDPSELQAWVPGIDPGMLTAWVVAETGLEFSFDEYVVGPGVFGAPTVLVSYGELDGLIDPAGPAAAVAYG